MSSSFSFKPQQIGLSLVWFSFIIYAFFFAPDQGRDTLNLILNLSQGKLEGINPLIVALFNIMGVLPAMYGCFLFVDGRGQKIPAWIFATGTFFLGAFALLPYLIFRKENPTFTGKKDWFLKLQDSRILGIILLITILVLLIYGFSQGNWSDFIIQWKVDKFIHVMSLDFCLLSLLFPVLLKDDLKRRNIYSDSLFWTISLIPLLGVAFYLCFRPSLPLSDD